MESLRNKKLLLTKVKVLFLRETYRSDYDGGYLLKAKLSTIEEFRQSQKAGGSSSRGEKGRLIRDPISIRPTVTMIFANCSTFGSRRSIERHERTARMQAGGTTLMCSLTLCLSRRVHWRARGEEGIDERKGERDGAAPALQE